MTGLQAAKQRLAQQILAAVHEFEKATPNTLISVDIQKLRQEQAEITQALKVSGEN